MNTTALSIVTKAYEYLGIKAEHSQPLDASKADFGFDLLVTLLDTWRLDASLSQTWNATSEVMLVPGQTEYTVGDPSSDLVCVGGERPETIASVWSQLNGLTYPMQIAVGKDYYNAPKNLNATSNRPYVAMYTATYPNGVITVYPAPSSDGYSLNIQYAAPIHIPSSLSENLSYSNGYTQAMIFGVAQLIAIAYNIESPKIDEGAKQYKQMIRNTRVRDIPNAKIDPMYSMRGSAGGGTLHAYGGRYDINSNTIVGGGM